MVSEGEQPKQEAPPPIVSYATPPRSTSNVERVFYVVCGTLALLLAGLMLFILFAVRVRPGAHESKAVPLGFLAIAVLGVGAAIHFYRTAFGRRH